MRVLFMNFSSAFNTLQHYLLNKKLYPFITNKIQHVKLHNLASDSRSIIFRAPQGCVTSLVLFTYKYKKYYIHTNIYSSTISGNLFLKFYDDTIIRWSCSQSVDIHAPVFIHDIKYISYHPS